jgi:hypothetical protein
VKRAVLKMSMNNMTTEVMIDCGVSIKEMLRCLGNVDFSMTMKLRYFEIMGVKT